MTKRSVDRKEKENRASRQLLDRAPHEGAASAPEPREEPSGPSLPSVKEDYYWYTGVVLAFLFSFYLRAIVPWSRVFTGGDMVTFSSESDAWYHMMLAKSTVMNLQRPWFDPMTYFPHGTSIHFGPLLDWGIALVSLIVGLGHPSTHTIDVIGALAPAVLGALLVFPVYVIGKELGGKSCGLISALMVAVLPGQLFSRTTLGFTDHHAAEIFFSALTMAFFLLAMRSGKDLTFKALRSDLASVKMPTLYSALAGVSLGMYIDAWSSGYLFEGILLLAIIIQAMVDYIKYRDVEYLGVSGAITFLLAMVMVLPFVKLYNGFTNYLYSLFQPTILLAGIAACVLIGFLAQVLRQKGLNKFYFPGAIVGASALGMLVMSIIMPQFTDALYHGLSIFQPRAGGAATVAEVSPLLYPQGIFSLDTIQGYFPGPMFGRTYIVWLSPFFLAILAMALMLMRYAKDQKPLYMGMMVWSVIILFLTLAENRFSYYYGVNVAVLTGFLVVWVLQELGLDSTHVNLNFKGRSKDLIDNGKVAVSAIVLFALIIYPSITLSLASGLYATGGPDSDWLTSTAWLVNNTPDPGMDIYKIYGKPTDEKPFAYPSTAYGIMSWWDYGHLIETNGHRIPNANPFQQGIGSTTRNIAGASPFFIAQNESTAEKVTADLDTTKSPYTNTKYVMIDIQMASYNEKFHAMASWSGVSPSKYYGAFYQLQGDTAKPIFALRAPYFQTMSSRLYYFDGSETPVGQSFAIKYKLMEQDGNTFSVVTDPPLISSNYIELQNYIKQAESEGCRAEIIGNSAPTAMTSAIPLEALQHFRLVHESENTVTYDGQKFVKTFEHVPGAVVTGMAAPGAKVSATVNVLTNQQRLFEYKQSTTSDGGGKFALVLPYSTEGPSLTGTHFDTMPIGPYQLNLGGKTSALKVPEEAVMSGSTIRVS